MTGNRVKKIFSALGKDVDIIVLKNSTAPHLDHSFFYVTGLSAGIFEGTIALLYPNGKLEVITSPLEEMSARKGDFKVTIYKSRDKALKILEKRLVGMKRIGLNNDELTHRDYLQIKKCARKASLIDISEAVKNARVVKDLSEISIIRKACMIVSRVAGRIPSLLKEGVRETEVSAEMSYLMKKEGAEGDAFTTIVAFGPNGAEPHYTAGARKLKKGDFVVTDFGAKYKRYCSDITRTYLLGKPTKKHKEMYSIVQKMQENALAEIRAGVEGRKIQEAAEKVVAATKYRGKFTHGIGHSIGLATHDGCAFTSPANIVLQENMVMTVEPGIYIPGFGGVRIEDDVVIKRNGYEILTDANRNLFPID